MNHDGNVHWCASADVCWVWPDILNVYLCKHVLLKKWFIFECVWEGKVGKGGQLNGGCYFIQHHFKNDLQTQWRARTSAYAHNTQDPGSSAFPVMWLWAQRQTSPHKSTGSKKHWILLYTDGPRAGNTDRHTKTHSHTRIGVGSLSTNVHPNDPFHDNGINENSSSQFGRMQHPKVETPQIDWSRGIDQMSANGQVFGINFLGCLHW